MITLKQFLTSSQEENRAALRVVRLLFDGIGQHAAPGDGEESTNFREKMKEASDVVHDQITPADLLVRAGWVLNEFEQHSQRCMRRQKLQNAELQNMVRMLTSALANISAASKSNVTKLSEIGRNITVASELDDVRAIKGKLSECLVEIQKEAKRQQDETAQTIKSLREGMDGVHEEPIHRPNGKTIDGVTGLPLRPDAEAAIADAAHSNTLTFVAVMVLERLQILTTRFGKEASDEILITYSQMVKRSLAQNDQLFRWAGAALVAILPRQKSLQLVRSEFTHVMETKLEHNIQTPSRSVLIPVSAKWCLYPMMAAPRLLIQKIDEFAAIPALRE